MISKSVGRTSTRNRKTKSNFEIWATRKAMEIERENHHQTFVDPTHQFLSLPRRQLMLLEIAAD